MVFLVSGLDKAEVLEKVLEGPYQPHELPAQLIRPNGAHPIWLVDKAASHKLRAQNQEDIDADEPIPMHKDRLPSEATGVLVLPASG